MKLYLRRSVLGFALYDFANSAFATTILAVIFNVYFVKVICAGGVPFFGRVLQGEAFWGAVLSASTLIVFFLTPILGAIADYSSWKKHFLFFFCALGCIATAPLAFCKEGNYWMAAFFFLFANTGFVSGNSFYNALLQDIATPATMGRISGFGWALGYIGGGMLLALNLAIVQKPEFFGIPTHEHWPVRVAIFSVAIWWALFSIPIFLWVKEKKIARPQILNPVVAGWTEVKKTLGEIRRHKQLLTYMAAYLIYNDGIETVIVMASIFGAKELGMVQGDLILCFLMIQAVAFFGSLIFGFLADRIGHKVSIAATLVIYIGVCVWGVVLKTQSEFWALGVVVGLVLGGSQAASRSLLALLVPEDKSAQIFGFFALAGKLSMVIGPLVFGIVAQVFSLRAAVGSLSVFFTVGLIILYFVREPKVPPAVQQL